MHKDYYLLFFVYVRGNHSITGSLGWYNEHKRKDGCSGFYNKHPKRT
jgi:hypothetical protein